MSGIVRCVLSHPIIDRHGEIAFKDITVVTARADGEEHAKEIAAEWAAKLRGIRHGPQMSQYGYTYDPDRVYLTV